MCRRAQSVVSRFLFYFKMERQIGIIHPVHSKIKQCYLGENSLYACIPGDRSSLFIYRTDIATVKASSHLSTNMFFSWLDLHGQSRNDGLYMPAAMGVSGEVEIREKRKVLK